MLGRGLGAILKEVEEAYLAEDDFSDKEYAKEVLLNILTTHGHYFILDILDKNDACDFPKSILVKAIYDKLSRKYPQLKKAKIREMVANQFNISDKAVQKHIYKGRIK